MVLTVEARERPEEAGRGREMLSVCHLSNLGAAARHWTYRLSQRRALGATSLLPDQSRPALTVDVWDRPAVGAASPISLGSTCPGRPDFGVSSQM